MYKFDQQVSLHASATIPQGDKLLRTMWVPCKVKPHPRPRIMGFGGPNPRVYQPLREQQKIAVALKDYATGKPIKQPIIVNTCSIFSDARVSSDYPTDGHFGDSDNLLKNILDAMVRIKILDDDKWVLGGENWKIYGKDNSLFIQIWSVK